MPAVFLRSKELRPWLRVSWEEGTFPACLWCGTPVDRPSVDGPLVCPTCDMGAGSGPDGKATAGERSDRKQHFRRAILDIRLAQTDEDKARIRELGGDPDPINAPDLIAEQEWAHRCDEHARLMADLGSKTVTLP